VAACHGRTTPESGVLTTPAATTANPRRAADRRSGQESSAGTRYSSAPALPGGERVGMNPPGREVCRPACPI
jgi:hypothetical protein